jgi:excisionase family DNA binding protein
MLPMVLLLSRGGDATVSDQAQETWLTVQDITRELKVHEETVRRWIRSGELPAILLGSNKGGYRIKRADFDQFVEEKFGALGKAVA